MRAEVVHDDDVPGTQRGDEDLADTGLEHGGVGRAVDGHARGRAVRADGGDHGAHAPVPVRCAVVRAHAPGRPSPEPRHVGFRAGLVEEHERAGRHRRHLLTPELARGRDVGTVLFVRAQRFFKGHPHAREGVVDRGQGADEPGRVAQLAERRAGIGPDGLEEYFLVAPRDERLAPDAPVQRRDAVPGLALQDKFLDHVQRHAKTLRDLRKRAAALVAACDDPLTEVQ